MIPDILEYDKGRLLISPQAYSIPELHSIIQRYDMNAEPYLMYVYSMSHPRSAYINIPEEDLIGSIVYDINSTLGYFDPKDPLLEPAILRMKGFYQTPMIALAYDMEQEIHDLRKFLRTTPITEKNMKDRQSFLEKIDKIATAYGKVKEQANKDIGVATKGNHEVGGYFD